MNAQSEINLNFRIKKWIGIQESYLRDSDIELEGIELKNNSKQGSEGELECEEVIMNEKERFGRVRTSMMKKLRNQHGDVVADRALSRINKRFSEGSLRINPNFAKLL